MRTRAKPGRLAMAAAAALGLAALLVMPGTGHAADTKSLSVDLSSSRGPSTGVGEGFLYGITQDGTQPADQYLQPLGINAFRGGGWFSGGWIKDNYSYGSATKADIASITQQARRLTQPPYHAQYQVILSDLWGNNGGQPSNEVYPCDNGNCSNWVSFIDSSVAALQATGLPFAYDIYNEPDISVFWTRGMNSTQYFQMWDSAYREIRRVAPNATIVGPSLAFTPQSNPGEWNTWLAHVKSAGTVPDMITNHDEGDVDDPVTVSQSLNNALSANGVSARPLSANEYQPADRQTAGVTAWYLARFAQSGYTNAMRGNWSCCMTPNLTGVLTQSNGTWQPNGNWWALRTYADMTGTLVNTSGMVGSTAISASKDSTAKRAVAVIGDSNGYTGAASVTFNGLASASWLANNGSVNVTVERIPDQYPLSAPQVVYNQNLSASSGSVTVPVTFQASHDAFAVYVTPAGSTGGSTSGELHAVGAGKCLDVPNSTTTAGTQLQIWDCSGGANQVFTRTSGNQLTVYSGSSQMCLDANGNGTTAGTKVIIWSCNGQTNQQWNVNSNGTVTSALSGLCLDVTGASTANGALAELWTCNGGSNQQWTLG
ncbi:RICIN domain-containing protein [Actinacidiphila bryophytorum]|uniref:Glycosyl hydrolases family 39 n=1 Tax=Actinacidiphila bryophytorum TaxID=1436133 RepID=A0A9W4GYB9_9ACTN|nr:RICIN domain-containing protein [Actinacidiphila bryophytorum]MBM9440443.1 ricin-type beta-trefoil lectin domain protein [Actinacidiphila bryophytorum]MBN6548039.1 ricin-type beta-trefoil lectin domain protein [Actinacidiphila bryophytorum]CAG7612337.1 Glycosyl hydrolases family 39 [Actinacidiphila bryophytorum]